MKYLTILIICMFSISSQAQESCNQTCKDIQQDVNTPVPKGLEGATITVTTKDGKVHTMKSEEFKVVKRKQQFKVIERVIVKGPVVMPKEAIEHGRALLQRYVEAAESKNKKNMIYLGVSYDYTNLDMGVSGNTVKLYSQKSLIFDLSYTRRRIFNSDFAVGLGINTNSAPRGILGLEF